MIRGKSATRRVLPDFPVRLASAALDRALPARRQRLRRWRRQRLARDNQARVAAELVARHGPTVQDGPFAGLQLPTSGSWGNLAPLLVGCYEEEIHSVVEELIARRPDVVINIGCAEGYYAIGLARRLPDATVHAYDLDDYAQQLTSHSAQMNGVSARVHVGGECTAETLGRLVTPRTLLVVDCEGCELRLLRPDLAPPLKAATLLVELHDIDDPETSAKVLEAFRPSHSIRLVQTSEGARKPYRALEGLSRRDRIIAVEELRPVEPHPMEWAVLQPTAHA